MRYDETVVRAQGQGAVEYGIAHGGPVVVFIKVGRGGDCYGFEDKYLKMAYFLREQYGCTVVCASNPVNLPVTYPTDAAFLSAYLKEQESTASRVYTVGSSNGALQTLELARSLLAVDGLLLVNMPLMINYHKTKAALRELSDRRIVGVWGERDPSAPYVRFVENLGLPNSQIEIIPNADHCFTGMTEHFLELPKLLFL